MVDLFQEFVRDELNGSPADAERLEFLNRLLGDVGSLRETQLVDALPRLRAVQESIPGEFRADPASLHLADLIQELEGLA
jgi:hypothetical protein